MKRILSVILSVVLIMNIFTVLALAGTVKKSAVLNESIRFIRAIDIMTKYTDADFEADKTVTRAEFAGVLADIINYKGETGISKVCTMTDVSEESEYAEKIALVTNLKYMNGNGAGEFYPDRVVTVAEAVKTVVSMTGFDIYANKMGGYPTGYLVTADQLGVLKHLDTSGDLTLSKLALILYNLRNVYIMEPSLYTTDGEITYSLDHGGNAERFMHRYFGVYYFEGLMTSNGITGLIGESSAGKEYVEINSVEYKINHETSYARNYIGRRVVGYYKTDEETNIKELVYLYQDDEQEFITFDLKDYADINGTTITYFTDADHNEEEEIEFVSAPYVIFNGKYATSPDRKYFEDYEYGTVTLTSSDFSNVYDTIIIDAYYSAYVADADMPNNIVYLSYDSPEVPVGDEIIENLGRSVIEVFDVNGNPLEFRNITSHSYIDIAKSDNVYKIIVNEKGYKQGFTVASVDENYYSNGTDTYFVSDKYLNSTKNVIKPVLGNTYNVFVNSFGAIVWFEAPFALSKYTVGYLIKYAPDGRGLTNGFKMQILAENGVLTTFEAAEKVSFTDTYGNSSKVKKPELQAKLNNYKGIIQYRINNDSEIVEILLPATADNPANDTIRLTNFYDNPETAVRYRSSILDKQVSIDNSTIIFSISEGLGYTDEKQMYQVVGKGNLVTDRKYKAKAYSIEKNSPNAKYMVIYDNEQYSFSGLIYVEKVLSSTNFDGEETVILNGYEANSSGTLKSVKYTVKKSIATDVIDVSAEVSLSGSSGNTYSIQKGDIIKVYKPFNDVEKIILVYRSDAPSYNPLGRPGMIAGSTGIFDTNSTKTSNPLVIDGGSNDYFYNRGYMCGYILNVDSVGNITYTTQDLSVEEYDKNDTRFVTGVIPYPQRTTLVTKKGNKTTLSVGELSDMRPYNAVGNKCSKIFFSSTYGTASGIFIFNEY